MHRSDDYEPLAMLKATRFNKENFRGGFTLVEALVASALLAVLAVLVLRVTVVIGKGHQAMASVQSEAGVYDAPLRVIRFDLERAVSIDPESVPGEMILTGYGALDPVTLEKTDRPARVVYRPGREGRSGWLVREQTILDRDDAGKPWVLPVMEGIARVAFEIDRSEPSAQTPAAIDHPRSESKMIRLFAPDKTDPVFEAEWIVP